MKVFYLKKSLFLPLLVFSLALSFFLAVYANLEQAVFLEDEPVYLPVIMYHSVLKDPARSGIYVIQPAQLEEDFKYLNEHGYTSVFSSQLIDYVEKDMPLPLNPVLITFDDGYLNNLDYVYPLLEKYEMKAVISIVGAYADQYTDNPDPNLNYAYLTWKDVEYLGHSGYVEIANHSYALHGQTSRAGAMRNSGESLEEYQEILKMDIRKNQERLKTLSGLDCQVFTYPYGQISPEAGEIIASLGIKLTFSCHEKINLITKDLNCLSPLGRMNRPSGLSTQEFMAKLKP